MEHKHTKRKKSGNTKEKVEILLFYIKDPLKKEILKRKGWQHLKKKTPEKKPKKAGHCFTYIYAYMYI